MNTINSPASRYVMNARRVLMAAIVLTLVATPLLVTLDRVHHQRLVTFGPVLAFPLLAIIVYHCFRAYQEVALQSVKSVHEERGLKNEVFGIIAGVIAITIFTIVNIVIYLN